VRDADGTRELHLEESLLNRFAHHRNTRERLEQFLAAARSGQRGSERVGTLAEARGA
jgi:hypothetical protein